ncbi:hypothetical protein Pint_16999 [Pistacia integerrima]|uniref:Uncharacterized protein n=1 Tax=Pistacia integerrima TaxID=434235 RepID=A0ACC0ZEV0_9ROSI|nr:hypothetical protein Pint_16999 [Pistacia integerrima]
MPEKIQPPPPYKVSCLDLEELDNLKKSKSQRRRKKTKACSEKVLEIIYGDETETSNQHDVILKKKFVKPLSGKKKVNTEPNTGKMVSKRRSKMPSYAELDEMSFFFFPPPESLVAETTYELDEMSIYVPTPESLVAETTNGDSSKTSCGNSDVSNSNRRDPNWNFANNLCSISCQEQDASCCSGVDILSGTIDDIELIHKHSNEDQMPAHMQNGKAETYTNGGTLRWTSDETDEH